MSNFKVLVVAILITSAVLVVELIGGTISNSLALLSDAGHVFTDLAALILALLAAAFAAKPATSKKTFGFYRLEILSALFNGSFLVLIALFIFYQSYLRLVSPQPVQSDLMLMVATIGLFANIGAAVILANFQQRNLNLRGAFLHVLSDAASSVGVILGGVLIHFFRFYYIDPILGILIGILILRGALGLAAESVNVLLEAAPAGMKVEAVAQTISQVKGVQAIHDLHVWTITSGLNAVSGHIVITDSEVARTSAILQEIKNILQDKYAIAHSTFQTECESCPEGLLCYLEPAEKEHGHEH